MDMDSTSKDTTAKSSHNNDLNHAIEIIKAAFPYLDSDSQQSMDFIIKTGELINVANSLKNNNNVTAFSMNNKNIDMESLLTNIRNVCYEKERELIDMILNFIKAKNFYNTYTAFAAMASQSENSENPENSEGGGIFGGLGNSDMMEILESMLTPEQKSTFDNINMMFGAMQ